MQITTSIDISAAPEQVFTWIENPDKALRWQKGVKNSEIIVATAGKTGTKFREVMEENGKTLEMSGEITDFIPNKLISFRLDSTIHRVSVTYSVMGKDHRTTLTADSDIQWKFPMNIITLLNGNKIKTNILRQINSELANMKYLCETENNSVA